SDNEARMRLGGGIVLGGLCALAAACQPEPPSPPPSRPVEAVTSIPPQPPGESPSIAEILAASSPEEWRPIDPENTLYMEFAEGRVVIEMAPDFAPNHVANVKALARE